jgi:hypothetical protein
MCISSPLFSWRKFIIFSVPYTVVGQHMPQICACRKAEAKRDKTDGWTDRGEYVQTIREQYAG